MELTAAKLTNNRTQRRQKRLIKNRRRNQRKKLEVKLSKRRKISRDNYYYTTGQFKYNDNYCNMTANAFWENYKVANDWQYRHNVAWWKSRCGALEIENNTLRDKIRELAATPSNKISQMNNFNSLNHHNNYHDCNNDKLNVNNVKEDENEDNEEDEKDVDNDNLEFHVDEEMMKFLEQSIRHKMELKRIRECENDKLNDNNVNNILGINDIKSIVNNKIDNSKLLYGTASSRILSMEASIQASIDQHKDRAKPHYWPHIPLMP